MTTYTQTQNLTLPGDILVTNANGDLSLTAVVSGSNAGATILIESSTDSINWSTVATITAAGSYPIAFGTNPLIRARCTVQGAAFFTVSFVAVVVGQNTTVTGQVSVTSLTPTVTAGAYTAGNVVGGLLTFPSVFGAPLTGLLTDILVTSKTVQTTVYKLYLFSAQPATTFTDKTAPAIGAADIPLLLGVFTLGAADSGLGTETTNQTDNINAIIRGTTQNLYGVMVCSTTPTYGSTSDLTVSVRVRRD